MSSALFECELRKFYHARVHMQISDIKQQRRRKDRFNIFVDGKFCLALDLEAIVKNKLKIDQEITQAEINELIKENELAKWYNRVLNLISFRPRTIKEINDFLKKNEVGEETSKIILEKLNKLRLVDDRSFAEWFIEQRRNFRPKGKYALLLELKQKGVPVDIISELLEEKFTKSDEMAQAIELALKKSKAYPKLENKEKKSKLAQFLARRGYSWSIIEEVLAKIMKESAFDERM